MSESRRSPGNPEAVLRRLEWTVMRRLDGLLQGDYRTLFRGFGLDLADLREYQYGDDVRHIDWNVTARMREPHVRVHVPERALTSWLVLDTSPSRSATRASSSSCRWGTSGSSIPRRAASSS